MDNLPAYVSPIFIGVCVAVYGFILYACYWAVGGQRNQLIYISCALLVWILVTGTLAYKGYFYDYTSMPPRLILFVAPLFIFLLVIFILPRIRTALLKMPITTLTYIHIVRIPVELCLWWLFGVGLVAEEMTFEGANFDIIAGISAPFAGVFLVGKSSRIRMAVIAWHLACLALLLNIVIRAVALTPYFYDGSGRELQNLAVFEFPFIWLPVFVVPAVLFSHLTALVILIKKSE